MKGILKLTITKGIGNISNNANNKMQLRVLLNFFMTEVLIIKKAANQSTCKSMDLFLYDKNLCHERVKTWTVTSEKQSGPPRTSKMESFVTILADAFQPVILLQSSQSQIFTGILAMFLDQIDFQHCPQKTQLRLETIILA